jgi:hypothetical protein
MEQAAKFTHILVSRAQIKMIGIAKNNVGAKFFKDVLGNGFD